MLSSRFSVLLYPGLPGLVSALSFCEALPENSAAGRQQAWAGPQFGYYRSFVEAGRSPEGRTEDPAFEVCKGFGMTGAVLRPSAKIP